MKKLILPLILILLLTFTLIGDCDWLSGYDQRIKLTIDNTKVDAALSDFPTTIFFTSTQGEEIFNEFDADSDYMKCAFTSSDGTTQLYAEKELFSGVSQYPPAQSDTYVKSTTKYSTSFWAYFATNPAKPLTGSFVNNAWQSSLNSNTNQRFHIDLGSAKIVKKIYYENCHSSGIAIDYGVQNFTFWGSNTGAGTFDDLVYANDEGWTQLTCSQNTFDQHSASDAVDPKYITVTNSTAYRYYAFKFADNHGNANYMGVRRIELQESKAIYHVKVTSVASGADTDIYYYYDNDHADNTTYIGAINTTAGGHVWDANFKAVYHMVDATTSTVIDSTSNNNDGTKKGANEPVEVTGKVGQGQDFDYTDDYIQMGDALDVGASDFTIEALVERDTATTAAHDIFTKYWGVDGERSYMFYALADDTLSLITSSDGSDASIAGSDGTVDTSYHYCAVSKSSTTASFYIDGTASGSGTAKASCHNNVNYACIGTQRKSDGSVGNFMDGEIDEVRVSFTARNAAWIKATYNSLWDTLLTYSAEEVKPSATNVLFLFSDF
ncbi:hypothetical protein KAX02_00725 [candidate division WOR-3 bacterium]|nr:hypothetical protein [candidate division WOR-3 bacterium]